MVTASARILGDGGRVGAPREAVRLQHGDQPRLAAIDLRRGGGERSEVDGYMARDQVAHGGVEALVGDMGHVRASRLLEELAREMEDRACA